MLPSRYNLIHALAAAAVLLTAVFWQGFVPFWRQFVYGLAAPMTPAVMLQSFLLTAALFGTLWLVLWASSLFGPKPPLEAKGPRLSRRAAVGLAARWSPLIIAVALGLNWLCAAGIELFKMLGESDELHDRQQENVAYFRDRMIAAGFDIKPTQSAICAVMLYDAKLSQDFAALMQREGIYVTGFYYPVVPKGQARIRVQLSAGHAPEHIDRAVEAFIKVGRELKVID